MSIADRVSETIEKMERSDFEGALFSICAAIEATAKKEFGVGGKENYKEFIHQNLAFITNIAFGGTQIHNINLKYTHPQLPKNTDDTYSIQDIFYHVIRCGFYHEAKIPSNLKFVKESKFCVEENNLVLPSAIIYGFILTIVTTSSNKNEKTSKDEMVNFGEIQIPLNKLWGRREESLWLLDCMKERVRIQSKSKSEGKTEEKIP